MTLRRRHPAFVASWLLACATVTNCATELEAGRDSASDESLQLAAACGTLASAESLSPGQRLLACGSENHLADLVFQTDGNLVLYARNTGAALWNSGTQVVGADQLAMQSDGNLVLYKGAAPVWNTETQGNAGARLAVQTDCNLVLYSATNQPLWSSGTTCDYSNYCGDNVCSATEDCGTCAQDCGTCGSVGCGTLRATESLRPGQQLAACGSEAYLADLVFQTDGNLVLYARNTGAALWNSGTQVLGADQLAMQSDGNLVLYKGAAPVWNTETQGNAGARLAVQTDCNLVLYSATNQPLEHRA